jgi:hypothetical protein
MMREVKMLVVQGYFSSVASFLRPPSQKLHQLAYLLGLPVAAARALIGIRAVPVPLAVATSSVLSEGTIVPVVK